MAFSITLLDVGPTIYGDCILCRFDEKTVLIDGAHPGDWRSQSSEFISIPDQLSELIGSAPPFQIDLLVVTHCHSDHIGCLPKLIADGLIIPKWALVADEKLGFGRVVGSDASIIPAETPASIRRVVAALREESVDYMQSDAEVARLIEDAAHLEDRYTEMLLKLENQNSNLVRFGRDSVKLLVAAFSDVGLKILGPSRDHLLICAEEIALHTRNAVRELANTSNADQRDKFPFTDEWRHLQVMLNQIWPA